MVISTAATTPAAAGPSSGLKREASPSQSPSIEEDGAKRKQKKRDTRRKVSLACVYCRRSHMTCDDERPCKRCIKREIGHLCHDEPPTKSHPHGPVAASAAKKGKRKESFNLSEAEDSTAGSSHSFGARRSPTMSIRDLSVGASPSGAAPGPASQSFEGDKQPRDNISPLPPPTSLSDPPISMRDYPLDPTSSAYPNISNTGSLFTHGAGLSQQMQRQSSSQQHSQSNRSSSERQASSHPQPPPQQQIQQQQQMLTPGYYRDPTALNQSMQSQGLRTPNSFPLLSLGLQGIGAANAQSSNNMSWLLGGSISPIPTPQLSTAGIGGAGWLGLGGGGHGSSEREGREPVSDAAGGLEYSILSEFLESLDGTNMLSENVVGTSADGQPEGDYGMTPAAMNQSVQTENEESMRPPRSENHGRSMSVSVPESPRIALDLNASLQPSASSASSRPSNGATQPPYPPGFSSKTERFFLTAADQIDGTRDERLGRVIQAKYDAGLLRPYNPLPGYARLQQWCQQHASPSSRRRILKPLSVFRPAFRQAAQKLSNLDLIYEAEAAERLLLDYDRVFSTQGVPACLWRRAGEIYKGNKEFAELVGVPVESLREGKLCIYELMTEESAVNYWEKYGAVSFDPGQKAVLTSCVLRSYNSSLAHARDVSAASAVEAQLPHSQVVSGGTTPVKGSSSSSVMGGGGGGAATGGANGEALRGALGYASAAAATARSDEAEVIDVAPPQESSASTKAKSSSGSTNSKKKQREGEQATRTSSSASSSASAPTAPTAAAGQNGNEAGARKTPANGAAGTTQQGGGVGAAINESGGTAGTNGNGPGAAQGSTSTSGAGAGVVKIECCFSFTIRRDGVQIPNLIIGNFLPVRIQR